MIKAVIFDMDGVIAMTARIQSSAESEVFAKIGIHITSQKILKRYSGFKDIDMFEDVLRRNKSKEDSQTLREQKWKLVYKEINKNGVPVIPGVIDLIERLTSAGYPLSIASATNLKFIQTVLKKLKIARKFKVVTSGDEVTSGKPNPEIFILTAHKLKIMPAECLVIEDAPSGVEASNRAGMKCLAITTTAKREELRNTEKAIDSFDELTVDYIKSL